MPKKINNVMTVEEMKMMLSDAAFLRAAKLPIENFDIFAEQAPIEVENNNDGIDIKDMRGYEVNEEQLSYQALEEFVDSLVSLHANLEDDDERMELQELENALQDANLGNAVWKVMERRALEDLTAEDGRSLDEKVQQLEAYENVYRSIMPKTAADKNINSTAEALKQNDLENAKNTALYNVALELYDQKRTNKSCEKIWKSSRILRPYSLAFQSMLEKDRQALDEKRSEEAAARMMVEDILEEEVKKAPDREVMAEMLSEIVAKDKANERRETEERRERKQAQAQINEAPEKIEEIPWSAVLNSEADLVEKILVDAEIEEAKERDADQMLSDIFTKDKNDEIEKREEETERVKVEKEAQEMRHMLSDILTKDKENEREKRAEAVAASKELREKIERANGGLKSEKRIREGTIADMKKEGAELQNCLNQFLETMGTKSGEKFDNMVHSLVQLQDGRNRLGIKDNIKEENVEMLRAEFEAAKKATKAYIEEKREKFNAKFGVGKKRLNIAETVLDSLEIISLRYIILDSVKGLEERTRDYKNTLTEKKPQADSRKQIGLAELEKKAGKIAKNDNTRLHRSNTLTSKNNERGLS